MTLKNAKTIPILTSSTNSNWYLELADNTAFEGVGYDLNKQQFWNAPWILCN